ncbi:MAG: LytTR family DNA-binding domain-containing protein [Pseudomonadota bacterium]
MNDGVAAETWAELRAMAGRGRAWLALLGAAALLGVSGPFGTYEELGLPARLAYWAVVTVSAWWLALPPALAVSFWAERRGLAPPMACAALGGAVAALPLTAWLAVVHGVVFDTRFAADALRLMPYVVVISATVAALTEALEASDQEAATLAPAGPAPGAAARDEGAAGDEARDDAADGAAAEWLAQLPPELGRELILLQAQDHYVRVETRRGEALIRGRLQDAAEALGGRGVRVHRSWWLARGEIAALRHRAGAPVAVLRDGREAPVGRTYRRALRAALG